MNAKKLATALASLRLLAREVNISRKIPPEIFETLLQVVPQVAVEIIVSRTASKTKLTPNLPFLLTRRAMREPRYGGWWHIPGSYLRFQERTTDVLKRLTQRELGGTARLKQPTLLAVLNHFRDPKGSPCLSLVYRCQISGRPKHGQWFTARTLPVPLVPYHREILLAAAAGGTQRRRLPHLNAARITRAVSGELLE